MKARVPLQIVFLESVSGTPRHRGMERTTQDLWTQCLLVVLAQLLSVDFAGVSVGWLIGKIAIVESAGIEVVDDENGRKVRL
jgi:hypothetical protein